MANIAMEIDNHFKEILALAVCVVSNIHPMKCHYFDEICITGTKLLK